MTHPRPVTDAAAAELASSPDLLGHDLRAALSDVIGGLRLIEQDKLPPATRVQLERIRAAGETLARLMEEALSQMPDGAYPVGAGAGGIGPVSANLHLPRLLHDAEMRWSGRAREMGLGFGMAVGAGVPPVVSLNRIALERVLSNVLANAIKYTDRGAIDVRVDIDAAEELSFRIRDNGPGFCEDALARLFQPGGRPGAGARPGTGLGLHIAKEMADRMGGHIDVRNRPQGGAEVSLVLPRAAWAAAAPGSAAVGLPDLSQIKVLLAEDNETNQLLLRRMLDRMGAECAVAADGVEALNWLDREDFDLALIDIEMPRLSGIEVIRALRSRGGVQAQIPVVAVTAYVLRANREAIYAAGADLILAKPVACEESFGQAIMTALGYRRSLPERPEANGKAPDEMDSARLEHLLDIAGPASAPELLHRLHSDLSAVERALVGALQAPDWAELRAQTHVLIALSGAVGAERLLSLARKLNTAVHRHEPDAVAEYGAETLHFLDKLIHLIARQPLPKART